MPNYTSATGDPAQGAVPPGEYNVLESLIAEFEAITGYQAPLGNAELLELANANVMTLADLGKFVERQWGQSWQAGGFNEVFATMPWAKYGLTKDEYISASSIYGTEYKKVTGSDISPEALAAAFSNPRDPTGGLLSGTQYQQQLMNDAAIQKHFGWVKYGLDFSSWTQTKLSMRGAIGRDINDAEAATILQYNKAATGATAAATARGPQQQREAVGVGGSVVR